VSQEERFDTRDRSYSAWHRRMSTGRFIGIEKAQLLAMIDLDASLYVEYDDGTKEPLALIETAEDVGQDYKSATVTNRLARRAGLPCYVVLYTLDENTMNPANTKWKDIKSFRVRRLAPDPTSEWVIFTPSRWADYLLGLRQWTSARLDASLFPDEL